MASSPLNGSAAPSSEAGGDTVIAQYLATKVSWWATYPRILIVTPSTLSTYNPETFQCTNQWEIADIEAVELTAGSNQFVLRLEKSRFRRSAKLRFTCGARGHFLSLLSRLRRQAHKQSLYYQLSSARRLYYRCYEQFANASHKLMLLQVTVSSIIFLDEVGRRIHTLPFLYLRKAAFSANHNEGLVLCTAFHERFFLCAERHECLNEIVAAAKAAGVELYKCASPLTVRQLRQHNREKVDRPSIIRFDVKKARHTEGNGDAAPGSEGSNEGSKKPFKQIQLILQGDAIVEMHRSLRTVIARPYSALMAIVRPDWDPRTLVLEFKQEDTLVLDVDGRDQLVTLLLLVCREAGQHHIILTSSGLNYCRFYHPHAADSGVGEPAVAGDSMETFLLCRITQTNNRQDESGSSKSRGRSSSLWSQLGRAGGPLTPRTPHGSSESFRTNRANSGSGTTGGWFQRRIKDMRPIESLYETRNSIDSGLSMNDNVSIGIAMEEFNANLSLDELAHSGPADTGILNQALELVFEHLVTLVATLRRYGNASSSDLVTTLQALVRLYHHPDAYFTDDVIPRVLDAVHELILQQDTLTCYWCLRLLQCVLGVRTSNTQASNQVSTAGDQRASMIQHFVQQRKLQNAIVDLLPASFAASTASSFICDTSIIGTAFWTPEPEMAQDTGCSSLSSSQSSILCTKEARVQNEINVVFYETLLTLHHALIHLRQAEKSQLIARDRNRYMAAGKRRQQQSKKKKSEDNIDDDDVPAAKQKEALAAKLLEKYHFLMDSIVDVRLVRMAETSVALVQFVLNHYTEHGCDRPRMIARDNQLGSGSDHVSIGEFYDTRGRRLGALASFLDDFRAVTEHRAGQARSFFFGSAKTIEMPLDAFSNATRSETTTTMLERMLEPGGSHREYTVVSNGSMRIEYLDPSEPSTTCHEPMTPPHEPSTPPPPHPTSPPRQPTSPPHERLTGLYVPRKAMARASSYDTYDGQDLDNNQLCHVSPLRPRKNALGQNSLMRFDSENVDSNSGANGADGDSGDTFCPMLQSGRVPNSNAKHEAFRGKASEGARRTAHECDACIGCNDVCSNERCFFCAEKEYQLHVAFAGSSVAAGPSVRQAAWQHRVPSTESSFNVEREYSSCEMRRHQTQRSCWICVDGSVYDVTDILGVHPGGTKVILEAAEHGGDCGPIMKTHPPSALEMLAPCRLGRFYECEKNTLMS